jgi:hypothetical protein
MPCTSYSNLKPCRTRSYQVSSLVLIIPVGKCIARELLAAPCLTFRARIFILYRISQLCKACVAPGLQAHRPYKFARTLLRPYVRQTAVRRSLCNPGACKSVHVVGEMMQFP